MSATVKHAAKQAFKWVLPIWVGIALADLLWLALGHSLHW